MISTKQLETLMSLLNKDSTPNYSGRSTGRGNPPAPPVGTMIDIPAWVERHLGSRGISIVDQVVRESGVTMFRLSACPWNPEHRHPDSIVGTFPSGGIFFRCLHNSCQDHTWSELRQMVERDLVPEETVQGSEASSEESELPMIVLDRGQLRDLVAQVNDAIVAAGRDKDPLLYVRGSKLARIIMDSEQGPQIEVVGSDNLPVLMSKVANFVRTRNTGLIDAFPSAELAKAVVKAGDWPFPVLKGITEIPVIRKDGTVLDRPGYDAASGLFYCPSNSVPVIPNTLVRDDARAAASFVLDGISDFPFDNSSSQANALALILSVVIRELVDLVPMASVTAPIRGSGKSRLAQIPAIIASGHANGIFSEVGTNDEWRKMVTSMLLKDTPVIVLDNLEHTLFSPHIAAALTTSVWSDRLLGKSTILTLPCRAIWIATGNNLRYGNDLIRRVYLIRLDARVPKPWLRDVRDFRHPFPGWIIENRNAVIVALLTMTRAWMLAGAPEWSQPALGSYEKWSKVIGGILEFCGVSDFLGNQSELYETLDEEPQQWETFFNNVFEIMGQEAFTIKTLIERLENAESFSATEENKRLKEALPESLGDVRSNGFAVRFGLAVRRHRDQRFEIGERILQLKIAPRDTHTQANRWKIVDISAS